MFAGMGARVGAELLHFVRIGEQLRQVVSEPRTIAAWIEKARACVGHDLGDAAHGRAHHRQAGKHGFAHDLRHALVVRSYDEQLRLCHQLRDVVSPTEKLDLIEVLKTRE